MAPTVTESFSFNPWTRETGEEGDLKGVLARVNFERGHFRTITEASLQEEIATEGALELSESEDGEDDEDEEEPVEDANQKPTTRAELYKAKNDMLANINAAEQELLMVTDFVSLLLSKDDPKRAQLTMSPKLRELGLPNGCLGVDIWQRMPQDKARGAQDELLSTHVRLNSLQKNADTLLTAANQLNDNVRKETEYWNQILSISERGWNVCRIPGPQRKLGVRFGFSESSPEFYRKGIAALHASTDGTVTLDRGIGSKPKGLRAILRRDGEIVGASKVPAIPDAEEGTLEARIRYARDSLFDEELFHEMIRESRSLASLGVGMKGSAIVFASTGVDNTRVHVSLDLVALDEDQGQFSALSSKEDNLAHAIVLAARLLLTRAHRDRLKKRSELPPPLSDKTTNDRPLLPLLRPVMAFIMHRNMLEELNAYLDTMLNVLSTAKVNTSCQPARFAFEAKPDEINAEALISLLTQPWRSTASLTISPPESESLTFRFEVETTLAYRSGPVLTLTSPSETQGHRLDNIEELIAATDAKIASKLAVMLVWILGEGWICNENEASLVKSARVEGDRRSVHVTLASEQRLLSLNSPSERVACRLTEDDSQNSFWDVARGMA
jgi:mediator of RNA polymerase II transcription subunit 17